MSEDSLESLSIPDDTISYKNNPQTFQDENSIKYSTVSYNSNSNRERSSPDQLKHLFEFMTTNLNLLTKRSDKGKRNNADIRSLWKKLTQELNNLGPPRRTTTEWKKIWASNKFKLKKKLSIKYSSSRMSSFGYSMESLDNHVKGIFGQKQYAQIPGKFTEVTEDQRCGKILNKTEKLQRIRQSCRICLENAVKMKSLERKLQEMYEALTGKPLKSHGLSSMKICEGCITELTRAYKFQLLCLKTEDYFISLKIPEISPDSEDSLKGSQEKMNREESLPDSTTHQLCNLCGKMLKAESMKAHLKRHEADQVDPTVRPFICSECGRSYRTLCNLQSHMSYTHTKSKSFKCRYCEDIFISYFRKRLHESKCKLQQQTLSHPCPICQQTFSQSSKRDDHVRVRHTFERPFKCPEPECAKSFFTKRVLRRHMTNHSSNKTKISCTICNKILRSWRSLATHMNSHDDLQLSQLTCHLCLETFSEQKAFALHMQQCNQCHLKSPIEMFDSR